jgi:NAD+ synthase
MPQTQEEFYYSMPLPVLDSVLFAYNRGLSAAEAADEVGLTAEQVQRAYCEVEQKRKTTAYLHLGPQLVESVDLSVTREKI